MAGTYSKEIIHTENGYEIKNYKKSTVVLFYISLFFTSLLILLYISIILLYIKSKQFEAVLFSLIFILVVYTLCFLVSDNIKRIIIDINRKEIIFRYRVIPFRKTIKLSVDSLKEISINYTADYHSFISTIRVIEKIYNVDLIDSNRNSYRIFQSEFYNDDLINFAKNISEILNIEVKDKNNTEGYKNIFDKNII